jgi:P-type E1-E2 ATPase
MVGDGANDCLALAQASVGIAVRGGIEASLRAADVYLSDSNPKLLLDLLDISKTAMKTVKRNLYISLAYNFIGISAAAFGYINPLAAAILMPLSAFTLFISTIRGSK